MVSVCVAKRMQGGKGHSAEYLKATNILNQEFGSLRLAAADFDDVLKKCSWLR